MFNLNNYYTILFFLIIIYLNLVIFINLINYINLKSHSMIINKWTYIKMTKFTTIFVTSQF